MLDARVTAGKYLFSITKEMNESVNEHISSAAILYQEIGERLIRGKSNARFPWQFKGEKWIQEMRHKQARLLEDCLELEKQAIVEITKARNV